MTKKEYLNLIGLTANPFQHTNADKESDIIDKYFISPDYFEDVWGDPENPVSNIVYAPRGGGKTAQRVMIEKRAEPIDNILTITYTDHDLSKFKNIEEVNSNYHLEYLNRLLLLSFFNRLNNLHDFQYIYQFSYKERQFIYKLCKIYLFETPASFPNQAINSLKSIEDFATDLWNKFRTPFAEVIKKISKAKGVEVDLSKIEFDKKIQLSHKDNLFNIRSFLERVGIDTVYVLVDKVDELSLTGNNPKASYSFISQIIRDLELLEMPGVGFKFFLWDELKQYCAKDARPDRVYSYQLKWTVGQIREMLNKRLSAFSDGVIKEASELFETKVSFGRVIVFSEFSPRDCIRICNRILSEQLKENPKALKFQPHIVNRSIDMFCKEKVEELISNQSNLRHLSKINAVSFTIEELVSKKVAADSPAIRNIIFPWTKSELLKKIGLVKRKSKKAVNEYAFSDIRMARYATPSIDLNTFIKNKIKRCVVPECKTFAYRDFDKKPYNCLECNTHLTN
ncbi:P-loop ATPase, Sll1717 family [Polaribacter sp.]|uniref:P-loop ATPase, Sll1717 family n=1 Tax=Polaribacter sp. TaxID=1920175 RepID=UPI003F6A56B8